MNMQGMSLNRLNVCGYMKMYAMHKAVLIQRVRIFMLICERRQRNAATQTRDLSGLDELV